MKSYTGRLKTIAVLCLIMLCAMIVIMIGNFTIADHGPEQFSCGTSSLEAEKAPLPQEFVKGHALFNANCTSCHALHEKVVGPPLAGVNKRHSQKWLLAFIRDAQKMIRQKDPEAVKVYYENNQNVMATFNHLKDEEIKEIIKYLSREEKPLPD